MINDKIRFVGQSDKLMKYWCEENKEINPDKISVNTHKKYKWKCEKGHIWETLPYILLRTAGKGCPYCSGRYVIKGETDLWTTNPEVAIYLKNHNDGYKYSHGSNVNLNWVCINCGNEMVYSPNKFLNLASKCMVCESKRSLGERLFAAILNQLKVNFKWDKEFIWSNKRRYDFYLIDYNTIVEINGAQHYYNSTKYKIGVKEQKIIDNLKFIEAKNNGIDKYIVINYSAHNTSKMIEEIKKSEIAELLNLDNIDWKLCEKQVFSNEIKEICKMYMDGTHDLYKIAHYFGYGKTSIISKLKKGAELGWCNYSKYNGEDYGKKKLEKHIKETQSVSVCQYDMAGNFLNEYKSIADARDLLGIHNIWNCCQGKSKSAGGYIWKYRDEKHKSNNNHRIEVIQMDLDGKIISKYESISEAERQTGAKCISECCSGKRKTSGGFRWEKVRN